MKTDQIRLHYMFLQLIGGQSQRSMDIDIDIDTDIDLGVDISRCKY